MISFMLIRSINCTVVELKLGYDYLKAYFSKCINCTVVELKLNLGLMAFLFVYVLIVPLWN